MLPPAPPIQTLEIQYLLHKFRDKQAKQWIGPFLRHMLTAHFSPLFALAV